MGTLLVLIGGLIGAASVYKKSFMSNWIFLINLAFSLYTSAFLAPLVVPLLDIPGLDSGYKNAIAIGGVFIVFDLILKKITEQIIPNPENDFNLPSISRLFSVGAGFLSGIMIVGILLFCFMQTPFVSGLSQKKELRSTARNTLMGVVYTVNVFSFQSLSPEAVKEMQSIRLLPRKKNPAANDDQAKTEASQDQTDPKDKTADGNVKKDSSEAPAKAADKPEETKKTEKTAPPAQS